MLIYLWLRRYKPQLYSVCLPGEKFVSRSLEIEVQVCLIHKYSLNKHNLNHNHNDGSHSKYPASKISDWQVFPWLSWLSLAVKGKSSASSHSTRG